MLGAVGGRTFEIPRRVMDGQQAPTVADQPEPAPQFELTEPNALQFVENQTQGVYHRFQNIKGLVDSAYKNHGIDVTNPDFSNPVAVRLNNLYQKAVADLRFEIDDLKSGQQIMMQGFQRGERFARGFDPTQRSLTQSMAEAYPMDRELDPNVRSIIQNYQNSFNRPEMRDQADQELNRERERYRAMLAEAQQRGNPAEIERIETNLAALEGGAMYDPTRDLDRQQSAANAAARGSGGPERLSAFPDFMNQFVAGDDAMIESLNTGLGADVVRSVRFNKSRNQYEIERLDKDNKSLRVDRIKPENIHTYGIGLWNQAFPDNKIGLDQVMGYDPKVAMSGPLADPNRMTEQERESFLQGQQEALSLLTINPRPGTSESASRSELIQNLDQMAATGELRVPPVLIEDKGNLFPSGLPASEVKLTRKGARLEIKYMLPTFDSKGAPKGEKAKTATINLVGTDEKSRTAVMEFLKENDISFDPIDNLF